MMSEIEDEGTAKSTEEAGDQGSVEVIDVQATVGRYLQSLVDDPGLQRASSSYVPLRLRAGFLNSKIALKFKPVFGNMGLEVRKSLLNEFKTAHKG